MRVTRDNIEQLQSLLSDMSNAIEEMEDPLQTWIDFQDTPPVDEDGRDDRATARADIDAELESLESTVLDLATLLGLVKRRRN